MASIEDILCYDKLSPTILLNRATEALSQLESLIPDRLELSFRLKLIEACLRLIYSQGYKMFCARSFLLGKLKRYEDFIGENLDLSIVRGVSPENLDPGSISRCYQSMNSTFKDRSRLTLTVDNNINERVLDTVEVLNCTQETLRCCERSIEQKREYLDGLNEEFNNVFRLLIETSNGVNKLDGSNDDNIGFLMENAHRRMTLLNKPILYETMADNLENDKDLLSQEEIGAFSDRSGGVVVPGTALSSSNPSVSGGHSSGIDYHRSRWNSTIVTYG